MTEVAPTIPALFSQCVDVYERMEKVATEREEGPKIYEGHLTRLISTAGYSTPYYTSITRALKSMGCIAAIRRGGGGAASQFEIIKPPTEELFMEYFAGETPEAKAKRGSAKKTDVATVAQQVRDLKAQVDTLTMRIEVLEAKVD